MSSLNLIGSLGSKSNLITSFKTLVDQADTSAKQLNSSTYSSTFDSLNSGKQYLTNTYSYAKTSINSAAGSLSSVSYSASSELNNGYSSVTSSLSNIYDNSKGYLSNASETLHNAYNTANEYATSLSSKISSTASSVKSEFTKTLYDKATSIANVQSVFLDSNFNPESFLKYGEFTGAKVFEDFLGTVDLDNSNLFKQLGWLTLDKSSNDICIVNTINGSLITSLDDFIPKSIISDFTPLNDKLYEQSRSKDSYEDDLNSTTSLAVTFKDTTSQIIQTSTLPNVPEKSNPLDYSVAIAKQDVIEDKKSIVKIDDSAKAKSTISTIESSKANANLNNATASPNTTISETIKTRRKWTHVWSRLPDYRSIQAIIYSYNPNSNINSIEKEDYIECYQQPDSISYSASAGYDSPSPRGAQQPFNFYTGANAMSLSFSLKFHYDELFNEDKTPKSKATSLQDIAKTAESLTRPWSDGNSVIPKSVKVILPGVTVSGYLTEASINYSGDMMGSSDHADNMVGIDNAATSYFYNVLEISFSLLIVQDDIVLKPYTAGAAANNAEGNASASSYSEYASYASFASDETPAESVDPPTQDSVIEKANEDAQQSLLYGYSKAGS